jgi:hypothetical protein
VAKAKKDLTAYRYRKLKDRAKFKNMPFSISYPVYKARIEAGCSYCGTDIKKEMGGGMDRIKNDEGYTEENTRSSCGECNEIRGYTLTVGEMEYVAKALNDYRMEHGYNTPMSKSDVIKMKKEKGWK